MRRHLLKTFPFLCFLITFLVTIPFPVQAAVVVLKNGDRITGRSSKWRSSASRSIRHFRISSRSNGRTSRALRANVPCGSSCTGERPAGRRGRTETRPNHPLYPRRRWSDSARGRARNQFRRNDYRGYISAGGNQTSGNTDTEALNISGNLMYRRSEHRFTLDGKYNRAQAEWKRHGQ